MLTLGLRPHLGAESKAGDEVGLDADGNVHGEVDPGHQELFVAGEPIGFGDLPGDSGDDDAPVDTAGSIWSTS